MSQVIDRPTHKVEGIDWASLSPPCYRKPWGCINKAEVLADWKSNCPHDGTKVALCEECLEKPFRCSKDGGRGKYVKIGPL